MTQMATSAVLRENREFRIKFCSFNFHRKYGRTIFFSFEYIDALIQQNWVIKTVIQSVQMQFCGNCALWIAPLNAV